MGHNRGESLVGCLVNLRELPVLCLLLEEITLSGLLVVSRRLLL